MRIHYLQHSQSKGLACIEAWIRTKGHTVSGTLLCAKEAFPELGSFDLLIIMGGPMNVSEEKKYPWLKEEKQLIEKSIKEGKFVLGICLGGQLIADVLGAKVAKNSQKEIGWFPITFTEEARNSIV